MVAITAGCAAVSPGGAAIIGLLAGILVVFAVEFIDKILKIDDPVGAVSVHAVCGAFGTAMVGLLAVDGGLWYGGGTELFVTQLIGIAAVFAWTTVGAFIVFSAIKATVGLRVTAEEEEEGLDLGEHGVDAYADFVTKKYVQI